ncbi:MAG: hypothetical protein O7B79_02115 [SAR324 cluster bacterium]|nr:hypothetical protein [SAR324 cluster bacterium]
MKVLSHQPQGLPMAARGKSSVLNWFKARNGKEIVIRMRGSTLRLQGRNTGIEELDACSADFEEGALALEQVGMQVALTFHDDSLSIHCLVYRPGGTEVAVSLPISIPYDTLQLSTVEEMEKGNKSSGQEDEEPEFSPYELLH